MLYLSHPSSLEHDPSARMPGHPDTPERLRAIERALAERDWLGWERAEAPAARERELELVHEPRHVEAVRDLCQAGGGAIDADTVVGKPSYRAALHAAGGACAMARALLGGEHRAAFSAARPPGHHAEPGRAMGFCLFDNVAIAAELALRELGAERVLILDWDVHHGNGTAEAFRHRSDVLYVSIHQEGIYPGTGAADDLGSGEGEGDTINLPVPAGSGEDLYVALLDQVVAPIAASFSPDLVLVSAGYDAHRADPLAECRLEAGSFGRLAALALEMAERAGAPVGAVLEGGYHPPALAESVAESLLALGGGIEAGRADPEALRDYRLPAALAGHWRL